MMLVGATLLGGTGSRPDELQRELRRLPALGFEHRQPSILASPIWRAFSKGNLLARVVVELPFRKTGETS
jgi:hypothetical protein